MQGGVDALYRELGELAWQGPQLREGDLLCTTVV